MIAEILSIGDELVSGQRLDTNTQWLARRLTELGVATVFHTTVGDDWERNLEAFTRALQRCDIVVSSGGLGPTDDDLTRQVLAEVVGRPLEVDVQALEHIAALFARRGRAMPEKNRIQACLPAGSRLIPNPHGTAPGIELEYSRAALPPAYCFALPGVPAEMQEMWQAAVAPRLRQIQTLRGEAPSIIRYHEIRCFGAGESQIEQMLPDMIRRGRVPTVGITTSRATITLRIAAHGASEEHCRAMIAPTAQEIRERLGNLVFGEGEEQLQHVVLGELAHRGRTLATAEADTTGLLAHWLGQLADRRAAFCGGLTATSAEQLARLLAAPLPERATTAEEAIVQIACSVRGRFGADLGLAVARFPAAGAMPDMGEAATPALGAADRLLVAIADGAANAVCSYPFVGHPDLLAHLAAKHALNTLRLWLRGVLESSAARI